MAYSESRLDDSMLRDRLARDRTVMANERTFLAYIRTALIFAISGATILKLFGSSRIDLMCGYTLIAAGVVTGVIGIAKFISIKRDMNRLATPDRSAESAPVREQK